MGRLTYKVLNHYFSIRCGIYNSHLYTTLSSSVSSSIHHAPLQVEALTYLYRRRKRENEWFMRKRNDCCDSFNEIAFQID